MLLMSHQAVTWALRGELPRTRATGSVAAMVLVVLAEYADAQGRNAFPSVETISAEARISRRSVYAALRELERGGLIARDGAGPRGVTRWALALGGAGDAPVQEMHPCMSCTGGCSSCTGGVQEVHPGGAGAAPEPPKSLQGNHQEEPPAASRAATGDVARVFDAWRESTGKKTAKLDPNRRKLIEKGLKLYDVTDLVDAVRGWRRDPFYSGQNDRAKVYNDLGLLLRNAEKIELFRDLERNPPAQPSGQGGRHPRGQQIMDAHAERVARLDAEAETARRFEVLGLDGVHLDAFLRGRETQEQRVARIQAEAKADIMSAGGEVQC